jgi:acetyl esterase/lipase
MKFFCNGSSLRRGVVSLAVAVLAFGCLSLAAQQPPAGGGPGAAQAAARKQLAEISTKVDSNVIYGMYSGLALLMDVYYPAQPNGKGVIFVHGGHWRMSPAVGTAAPKTGGNIVQLVAFIKPFVDAGYTVFVPDYRMAPRFTYPAPVEDIQRAVRFVRFNAKKYDIDPDHIGGVGFSAGAHLISMVALMDGKPTDRDQSPVGQVSASLQAVVSGATPANLGENASVLENAGWTSGFIGDLVAPGMAPNSEVYKKLMAASPITYVAAGAPPFFLIHADKDAEVPMQIEVEFQQALEKVGTPVKLVVVPDTEHEATFVGDNAKVFTPGMVAWMDQYLQAKTTTSSAR